MMQELDGLTHGWSLAGAGGGGFLCLITKEPNALESIKARLESSSAVDAETLEFFTAQVDTEGLQTTYENDCA